MRTNIDTLISALHILANDIQSEDDVANTTIREAAERLQEGRELADRLVDFVAACERWVNLSCAVKTEGMVRKETQ